MNYSQTQLGHIISIIGFLLGVFKVDIGGEEVAQFVNAGAVVIGLALAWYGRWRKGDLTVLGARK